MRMIAANALFVLIVTAIAAAPGNCSQAAPAGGFVSWALDRSSECDARWNAITAADAALSGSRDGTSVDVNRPASADRVRVGSRLNHSIITTRSFIHEQPRNQEYLPLTTRPRNGASRGVWTLSSPAQTELTLPNAVRRPLNSSMEQKHFIRNYGTSISRPRLSSFGRLSGGGRHGLGTPTRPAQRASRPRIL
jgi:hypothetical protein